MKQRSDKRRIYLRTVAGFLVFYLLAMRAMTALLKCNFFLSIIMRQFQIVQDSSVSLYDVNWRDKTLD